MQDFFILMNNLQPYLLEKKVGNKTIYWTWLTHGWHLRTRCSEIGRIFLGFSNCTKIQCWPALYGAKYVLNVKHALGAFPQSPTYFCIVPAVRERERETYRYLHQTPDSFKASSVVRVFPVFISCINQGVSYQLCTTIEDAPLAL